MNIKLSLCRYCNKPVGLDGHNCPAKIEAKIKAARPVWRLKSLIQ